MTTYQVKGNQIIQDGEIVYAVCEKAQEALKILKRAWYLNDVKRQYSAAARLIAQAEALPGFKFILEGDNATHDWTLHADDIRRCSRCGLSTFQVNESSCKAVRP